MASRSSRNREIINAELLKEIKRRVRPILLDRARVVFENAKSQMFYEIRTHPVSKELTERTPDSKYIHGAGSLFGFMGFEEHREPVEELISHLERNIEFTPALKTQGRIFVRLPIFISFPSINDFDPGGDLDLPWQSGKSWPVGIETGISGLPYFIYTFNFPNSQSGEGAQAKVRKGGPLLKVRDAEFVPTSYLGPIFKNFRRRVVGKTA